MTSDAPLTDELSVRSDLSGPSDPSAAAEPDLPTPAAGNPSMVIDGVEVSPAAWAWLQAEAQEHGIDPPGFVARLVEAAAEPPRRAAGRHSAPGGSTADGAIEDTQALDAEIDRRLAALSEDWREPPAV